MRTKSQKQNKNQQGVAAIFVVMILMALLALISIGFSRLMNREVRQSLDRQLSTAAYYAAESGVNDARDYLASGGTSVSGCAVPTDATGNNSFVANGDIDGNGLFKYSCVIVNPTPKELQFTIAPGESQVIKISATNISTLSNLYFGWQNADPPKTSDQPLGTYGLLPQQTGVGHDNTGLLRVGIYPIVASCSDVTTYNRYAAALGGDTTDATLECASRNYFMYPSAGSGAAPNCGYATLANSNGCVRYNSTSDNGGLVPGNCKTPAQKPNTSFINQATPTYCNTKVSNLVSVNGAYYIRLTAEYQTIKVFVQATDNSAPIPQNLNIVGAEAVIDVTGTGNDVSRRIQVRAPLQNIFSPDYGLQSMESVCKLFRNDVPGPDLYNNPRLDPAAGAFNTDNYGKNCSYPTGSSDIDPTGLPPISLTPPPTVNIGANPSSVNQGSGSTITWSSTNADSCVGTNFSTGPGSPTGGTASTGSLGSTTTYTVTCTGPSGTSSDSVTVNVILPPPPDCNDHGHSLSPNSYSYWHAEITGNNPCGVGIAQCVVQDFFTTETHGYGNANPVDDSSSMVGSVSCQDIMGHWF